MTGALSQIEAARMRGDAIRKHFDLPQTFFDPATTGGETAAEAEKQRNKSFHACDARIIRIGGSSDKTLENIGVLNEFDIVAAILRVLPETEQIWRGTQLLFEAGR